MPPAISDLDSTTRAILAFIERMDSFGAKEIDLRSVSATTALLLFGLRSSIGHRRNIDWDALIHAIITGVGSLCCVYLDLFASETLTGVREPLRSLGSSCAGPLTSLHRIIPAVTQGYALCDIMNGFRLGPAFLAHGVMTLLVMIIFNESNASHLITPMLVMEMSTITLSVLRADFFTPTMQLMSQACFALSFFFFRIVLSPFLYYQIISTMYHARRRSEGTGGWCFPDYLYYTSLLFGGFFNCLNFYWFLKLIKKINRKLKGNESLEMKEKLDD